MYTEPDKIYPKNSFPQYFSQKDCFIINSIFVTFRDSKAFCKRLIWIHSSLVNKECIINILQVKNLANQQTLTGVWSHRNPATAEKTNTLHLYLRLSYKNIISTLGNGLVATIHAYINLCSAALLVTEGACCTQLFFAMNPYTAMEDQGPAPRKSCLYERSWTITVNKLPRNHEGTAWTKILQVWNRF